MQVSSEFESDVLDVIKNRRSLRAFDSRPIESQKIKSLFEAARWAPSSSNEQPWTYVYATQDQPELWQLIFDTLMPGNRPWAKNAYLLVVSLARRKYEKNNAVNNAAKYDIGAANAFLSLQATQLGLITHQMGGFDQNTLRTNLRVPEDYEIGVVIAVGYPGDANQLPEPFKEREFAPRFRRRQDDFVLNSVFE